MIIGTKIQIPTIRMPLIKRPDLIQRLSTGSNGKLTLLTAPAGYGKSTLLGEWTKTLNARVAWLSLDKQEDDFERFWNYVIAAIDKAVPETGPELQPVIAHLQSAYYEPMITMLLAVLGNLPDKLVFVLDDFHVIEHPSINASLSYLLDHLPSCIHIVLSSRHQPTLPTARLQSRNELHQLSLQDLRFQPDEGIRYFQTCMNLNLSDKEAAKLVEHTEGWISGLQLAAISIRTAVDPSEFIHKFSGHQRQVSTYLLEEVFARQPEHVRRFLLNTSILSRMNSSLCQAMTGLIDSQARLEQLESQHLFIIPLDERGEWYRYHHLFSEFLQHRLRLNDPEQWERSHAHAAEWLQTHGYEEEAVDHYIIGKQYSEAAVIIEKLLPVFLTQSKRSSLRKWLTALPEDLIASKPMLEIFYFSVLIMYEEWHLAKSRITMILDKLSDENWAPYAGFIYLSCANFAIIQKDAAQASDYLAKFHSLMPEGSHFQMIGGNTARSTDYDHFLSHLNDLHIAEAFIKRWLLEWKHRVNYPFVGYFMASYSELLYEWNRLEEAEKYAEQALERQDMRPYARIHVRAAIQLSLINQARGRWDLAQEIVELEKLRVSSSDRLVFIGKIEAHKVRLSLLQGKVEGISAWVRSCGLNPTDAIPLYRVPEYLTLARALELDNQQDHSAYLLDRLYSLVDKENRLRDKIHVLIAHSMMDYRNKNTETAIGKLALALQLAEPHGYIRSFVDEGVPMSELLSRYLHMRQNHILRESNPTSVNYIKKLLQVLSIAIDGTYSNSNILTGQESNILRLIEKGLTNKQMAEQLFVSSETVRTHIKHIYAKLEVNNRLHVIQRAKELRLL